MLSAQSSNMPSQKNTRLPSGHLTEMIKVGENLNYVYILQVGVGESIDFRCVDIGQYHHEHDSIHHDHHDHNHNHHHVHHHHRSHHPITISNTILIT